MNRPFHSAALLLAAMALSGCTKEEPLGPCSQEQRAEGGTKAMATAAQAAALQAAAPLGGGRNGGDGEAIGDDGDDLSGSERGNRKRNP